MERVTQSLKATNDVQSRQDLNSKPSHMVELSCNYMYNTNAPRSMGHVDRAEVSCIHAQLCDRHRVLESKGGQLHTPTKTFHMNLSSCCVGLGAQLARYRKRLVLEGEIARS